MSLKELSFKMHYDTDVDNVTEDFYKKALKSTTLYRRAVGPFTGGLLPGIFKGTEELLNNNGRIELLISPKLSLQDIERIRSKHGDIGAVIYENLSRELDAVDLKEWDECNFLAWLLHLNRLHIRVVLRKGPGGFGTFNDDFGLFYDEYGGIIAFKTTMDGSGLTYSNTYESVDVFHSWDHRDCLRIKKLEEKFVKLWENIGKNWITHELPVEIRCRLLETRSDECPLRQDLDHTVDAVNTKKTVSIPDSIKLRDYQKEAIKAWLKGGGKGIFEMATGTGKTITGISAMVKLIQQYNKNNISCGIVVVVPYKVLLEQWEENLRMFGINPIKCYESKLMWQKGLDRKVMMFNSGMVNNLFVITTNSTFRSDDFQRSLRKIDKDYILCIDEMHHFTTEEALKSLPQNCTYKLGLSATLMTRSDSTNMNKLIDYFEKGIVYEFPLAKAIDEGYLTPYYYYPVFVELTDEEKEEYFEITARIGRRLAASDGDFEDVNIRGLLIKRARLIGSASNKLAELKKMKELIRGTAYNLFYCGDRIESDVRYIDRVNKLLAHYIGIKTHTFTSRENRSERTRILKDFSEGRIEALTAIRCLDEGVDIPRLKRAFILSSGTNPKEFIQRRGRILRKSQGKEYAEIYDFFVVPTLDKSLIEQMDFNELIVERKIIAREFERFKEFADLALNKHDAYNKILKVWRIYDYE